MKQLWEIYNKYKVGDWPDKGTVHSYIEVYEEILAHYRETAKNVLEIGLFNGASLRMWEQYFFNASVYGIDCHMQPHGGMADLKPMIDEGTHRIIIGDATDEDVIDRNFRNIKFDVIIEDAAHNIEQQLKLYKILKPYLNDGALYAIEDIQDLDKTREIFEKLDSEKDILIIDRRHVKGRYDDCIILIKDKE